MNFWETLFSTACEVIMILCFNVCQEYILVHAGKACCFLDPCVYVYVYFCSHVTEQDYVKWFLPTSGKAEKCRAAGAAVVAAAGGGGVSVVVGHIVLWTKLRCC